MRMNRFLNRRTQWRPTVVNGGQLLSAATFTRDSTKNGFDADGLLVEFAVDTPASAFIDSKKFFWPDGAVTEISGYSDDYTNWGSITTASVAKDAVGLDGEATSGWTITDDSDSVTQARQVEIAITSGTSKYIVTFTKKFEASPSIYPRFSMQARNGTILTQGITFDPSDGSHVETQGDGEVLSVERIGDFWHVTMSLTDNDSGNTALRAAVQPAFNTDGTVTNDVTAQGSTVFGHCALFKDNWSLMPILTTGGNTKTVNADDASLALGSWFNAAEGTVIASVWLPELGGTQTILELRNDDSNRIRLQVNSTGKVVATVNDASGTGGTITSTGSLTAATEQKVALVWGSGGYRVHINGSKDGEDATLTVPTGLTTSNIGNDNGSDYLFGGLSNLPYHPRALTEAEANAETTV